MKIPDSLKKVISSKVLKKAEAGGESKVSGLKTLNEISNNLNFLPNIARDLNVARQNIFKLVKLEGGKPERANNIGSGKTEKSPTPVFKDQAPTYKKVAKEESSFEMGQRFASFFLDLFNPKKLLAKISLGAIFIAAGIITLFKDAFTGLAEYLFDAIKESFSKFMDFIKTWFDDSVQPILDEMLNFMNEIWTKVTDFFKPIFDWVGDKIKTLIDFLEPVFTYMRSIFDKAMVLISPLRSIYDGLINSIKSAESKTAKVEAPPGLELDAEGNLQESAEERQKKAKAEVEKKKKEEESKKPPPSDEKKTPLPPTGAGGGRGGQGGPTAAELIKKDLTPSQLKWLGNADATDQNIMARMPAPIAGEKGGPPAPAPAPAPAPPPAPAPAAPAPKPPAAPAAPTPSKPAAPAPSAPAAAPTPAPAAPPKPPAAAPSAPTPAPAAPAPPSTKPSGAAKKTPGASTGEPLVKKISPEAGKKALLDEMNKQKVSDPTTRAAIMAQAAKETGGFNFLSEDLRYSVSGLSKTFQRLKNTSKEDLEAAVKGGAGAIGALIYGGSSDSPSYAFGVKELGNTEPGDGAKYRGRGFFQLTGRANYKRAGALEGPEKLLEMGEAAKTAVDFALRYKGDFGDVKGFTKYVNGAYLGLKERGEYFNAYINDPAITKIGSASTTPSGGDIASASNGVASDQRKQQKPTTPVVIDASTTNNTQVTKNESGSKKQENTNKKLLERVT